MPEMTSIILFIVTITGLMTSITVLLLLKAFISKKNADENILKEKEINSTNSDNQTISNNKIDDKKTPDLTADVSKDKQNNTNIDNEIVAAIAAAIAAMTGAAPDNIRILKIRKVRAWNEAARREQQQRL